MRFGLRRGYTDRKQSVTLFFQVSIAVILLAGLLSRNLSVVVNASLALAATFIPAVLARDYRISLRPGIVVWISVALFLHSLGMLGLYDNVWWFDHVTHTLSATIVAAIGYVAARAIADRSDALSLPPPFMFVYILLFTLALGVFWEVLEFGARLGAGTLGLEPVLVQYGLSDTLLDLVFNTVGAFLVAVFGTRLVSDIAETVADRLDERRPTDSNTWTLQPSVRTGLERILETASTNTWLAWVIVVFLIVVAPSSALRGRVLQTVFIIVLLVLVLLPAISAREIRLMLPWQLLLIASLPVVGNTFVQPGVASGLVTYVSVAAIALVIAVELHLFTDVRMTPGFAVFFVMITTVATAGVWAVGRWLCDLYLGTQFLLVSGVSESVIENTLMWEFVYSALTGIAAGVLYEVGFRDRTFELASQ